MTELLDAIRARGHWRVAIRPLPFVANRVLLDDLEEILAERQVQFRGWYVPHISRRDSIAEGTDWIGQDSSFGYHVESWKFYSSGQFAMVRGFQQDWRDDEFQSPDSPFEIHRKRLQVWAVLYFFTEVLELAARLALSPAGSEQMSVRITTAGIAGRQLVIESPGRLEFDQLYISSEDEVVFDEETNRERLAANGANVAVRASQVVFEASVGGLITSQSSATTSRVS